MITGAAPTSTLHESRLKIILQSVESDSESSSEVTKLRLRFSESFRNNFLKKSDFFSKNPKFSEKKCNFPRTSINSNNTIQRKSKFFGLCYWWITSLNRTTIKNRQESKKIKRIKTQYIKT